MTRVDPNCRVPRAVTFGLDDARKTRLLWAAHVVARNARVPYECKKRVADALMARGVFDDEDDDGTKARGYRAPHALMRCVLAGLLVCDALEEATRSEGDETMDADAAGRCASALEEYLDVVKTAMSKGCSVDDDDDDHFDEEDAELKKRVLSTMSLIATLRVEWCFGLLREANCYGAALSPTKVWPLQEKFNMRWHSVQASILSMVTPSSTLSSRAYVKMVLKEHSSQTATSQVEQMSGWEKTIKSPKQILEELRAFIAGVRASSSSTFYSVIDEDIENGVLKVELDNGLIRAVHKSAPRMVGSPKRIKITTERKATATTVAWNDSQGDECGSTPKPTPLDRVSWQAEQPSTMSPADRRKKCKWTDEEEAALIAGVKKFGIGNWKVIMIHSPDVFNTKRTTVDLKDKWRVLSRRWDMSEVLRKS